MNKTVLSILAIVFSFALGHSQNKSSLFKTNSIPSFSIYEDVNPFVSKKKKTDFFYKPAPLVQNLSKQESIVEYTYNMPIEKPEGSHKMPNHFTESEEKRSLIVVEAK